MKIIFSKETSMSTLPKRHESSCLYTLSKNVRRGAPLDDFTENDALSSKCVIKCTFLLLNPCANVINSAPCTWS